MDYWDIFNPAIASSQQTICVKYITYLKTSQCCYFVLRMAYVQSRCGDRSIYHAQKTFLSVVHLLSISRILHRGHITVSPFYFTICTLNI